MSVPAGSQVARDRQPRKNGPVLSVAPPAPPTPEEQAAIQGLEDLGRVVKSKRIAEAVMRGITQDADAVDHIAWAWTLRQKDMGAIYQQLHATHGETKWLVRAWDQFRLRAEELVEEEEAPDESEPWDPDILAIWPWLKGRLVAPAGWRIGLPGVEGEKVSRHQQDARAASAPLVITGRLRDVETGQEQLRLEWSWGGERPTAKVIPRVTATDPRQLVSTLTPYRAPVDGTRGHQTVRYLVDFERANHDRLPLGRTCSRMGWVDIGDGRDRYVLGRSVIAPGGGATDEQSPDQWAGDHIHVQAGGGKADLSAAHRTGGTWEGWLKHVARPASEFAAVKLLMLASLVPPLMRMIPGLQNAVVDLPGETSTGKSSAQYVAASLWGYPDERGGIVNSWAQTPYWMESTATFLDGLPLFLGDTRNAEGGKMDPAAISNTIFAYAQGRGGGRGSYGSSGSDTRAAGKWSGVLIYTGEVSSVSLTEQGGTRARVMSLHGSPFGAPHPGLADTVDALKRAAQTHYGHFARRFIQHLVEAPGIVERVQEMHAEASAHWRTRAGEIRIVHRSAGFLAALEVAAVLAGEVGLPGEAGPALDLAYQAMSAGALDGDRPRAALASIYEWALSHRHRFEIGDRQPRQDGLGLWAGGDDWQVLAFLPTVLKAQLKALGHDVDTTIRLWAERKWLIPGEQGRPHARVKVTEFSDPTRPRMYQIRRSAIDALHGDEEE